MADRVESAYMSTPVENFFIDECLGHAPGDFVKVYLYGLRFALYPLETDMSLEEVSRALRMAEEEVTRAVGYWERMNLLRVLSLDPLRLKYLSVQQGLLQVGGDQRAYRYRDFSQALQIAAGSRQLQKEDFQTVYDWIEVLGLPTEAIMLLVKHFIQTRHNMGFGLMDKKVRALVRDQGVCTLEQVEAYLRGETVDKPARQVLERWNIYRAATQDEGRLWDKWTGVWGMDPPAVLAAAASMTQARNPSFKYLDKMLATLHEAGVCHENQVRDYLARREAVDLAFRLGSPAQAGQLASLYAGWLDMGFSPRALDALADHLSAQGQGFPEALEDWLARLAGQGVFSDKAVEDYLAGLRQSGQDYGRILALWGETRQPTASERAQWNQWLKNGWDAAVLEEAARAAAAAQNRPAYMNAVLKGWKEKGVSTPEAARTEGARRPADHGEAENLAYDKPVDYYKNYFSEIEEL